MTDKGRRVAVIILLPQVFFGIGIEDAVDVDSRGFKLFDDERSVFEESVYSDAFIAFLQVSQLGVGLVGSFNKNFKLFVEQFVETARFADQFAAAAGELFRRRIQYVHDVVDFTERVVRGCNQNARLLEENLSGTADFV